MWFTGAFGPYPIVVLHLGASKNYVVSKLGISDPLVVFFIKKTL